MDQLEKIKREIDLRQYASVHYNVQCNSEGKARCPFHSDRPDKNPSFEIKRYNGGWRWYDWHLDNGDPGFSGTIVDFVAKMDRITGKEACSKLLKDFSDLEPVERKVIGTEYYLYKNLEGTEVYRKVKQKHEDGTKKYWIELKDQNEWRRPKKNEEYDLFPYNVDRFKNTTHLFICEGEKDADTVNKLNTTWLGTSAPFGCNSWPEKINPYFEGIKDAVFLYDVGNERYVQKHATVLQNVFPKLNINIAHVPLEKHEADITDYLNKFSDTAEKKYFGPKLEKFIEVLTNAKKFKLESSVYETAHSKPILISLDTVNPEQVEWLWFNRIPMGKLSLLVGDPGVGKSFLTIYFAAKVTNGNAWPDSAPPAPKGSVIILTAEDGIADTVRVRSDAVGANTKKIKILDGIITTRGEIGYFNLVEHIPALEQALKEIKDVRLVIIDPITSYLSTIDSHNNSEVRGVLAPLASLAERNKIAVVAVSHLNKNENLQAIYRTMGSIAFTAAARSVWAVTFDKSDKEKSQRLFIPFKSNLSVNATSLSFGIIDKRIVFGEHPIVTDPERLLSINNPINNSALNQAVCYLTATLKDGPVASDEIFSGAEKNKISAPTVRRAQKSLGIVAFKGSSAEDNKWFWKLPEG